LILVLYLIIFSVFDIIYYYKEIIFLKRNF
jgi:hypothetical protein